jgi:hypothetical protein
MKRIFINAAMGIVVALLGASPSFAASGWCWHQGGSTGSHCTQIWTGNCTWCYDGINGYGDECSGSGGYSIYPDAVCGPGDE